VCSVPAVAITASTRQHTPATMTRSPVIGFTPPLAKGGLATFSPPLDAAGNSVRGQLVTKYLAERLGLNLFASEPAENLTASPMS
jgi:Glutaminase